jgi:nucleotide-binding universal stress UspA family protein
MHMLKSFFVAFNESDHATAALHYSCFLASLTRGKLHVGTIIELPYAPVLATGMAAGTAEYLPGMPPVATFEELETYRKELEKQAETVLVEARRICNSFSVACQTQCLFGYMEEEILNQARSVDLVAIGQSSAGKDRRKIGHVTEVIVRSSPQPVLIATGPYEPPSDILILYNGDERAIRTLCIGAEIARQAGLPLHLITVAHSPEEGETVKERGAQYLRDQEVEFKTTIITAKGEPDRELVTRLNDRPKALVLMGAFGESRMKEWLSGSTTRLILEETQNPIILFRR